MKVLLSGVSSFTGFWFAQALRQAGHEVVGVLQKESVAQYSGLRKHRVERFLNSGRAIFGATFGTDPFLGQIGNETWDVYCHHAADVTNYRSSEFDPIAAVAANTHNLANVLVLLQKQHCQRIVVTGSIFERGEGIGSDHLPHISRYGLSKSLSWEIFHHECQTLGIPLGKFVIPNPFGPLEEPRFTSYLVQSWQKGEAPLVRTPEYIRDNVPVDLLALSYVRFIETGGQQCHPSGYVESQGQFARRFASEFQKRTSWECPIAQGRQTDFSEPMIRVNHEPLQAQFPNWDEKTFWDSVVDFYKASI